MSVDPFARKRELQKSAPARRSQLWGFTGNGVWTDSVQGVRENNFRLRLSTDDYRDTVESAGEIRSGVFDRLVYAAQRTIFSCDANKVWKTMRGYFYPPLEGGSKFAKQISGRGSAVGGEIALGDRPLPEKSSLRCDFSTLPQGEGRRSYRKAGSVKLRSLREWRVPARASSRMSSRARMPICRCWLTRSS